MDKGWCCWFAGHPSSTPVPVGERYPDNTLPHKHVIIYYYFVDILQSTRTPDLYKKKLRDGSTNAFSEHLL